MKRATYFIAGLFLALTFGALAADSVTPSRLRLLSLGVGSSAPSTNGDIAQTTNRNDTLQTVIDNDSNGTANAARVSISSGDANGAIFVSGSGRSSAIVTGGPTGAQMTLRTLGNYPLVFGTSNTSRMQIDGAGVVTIAGSQVCTAANGACPQSIPSPSTYTGVQSSTVGPLTFNSGSFTAGVTGCTTGTGPFVVWSRRGWEVEIQFQKFQCTSNGLLFRLTGFPAEIRTGSNSVEMMVPGGDNGVQKSTISCHMTSSGALECSQDGTAWTGSGQKWLGNVTNGTSVGLKYSLAW